MSCPNVLSLLLERESGIGAGHGGFPAPSGNLVGELERWVEDDMVEHTCADYVSFQPPPRSTIAVAYNADGSLLASSHGDHTVKITCCKSHKVLRSLTGHRRTPWAVRFHPRVPHLVASGSLDNEVRLWDARTGECFLQHTFGKPIASLSFHATAHVLGVACGHKVYMWEYGHALVGRVGSDLGLPPTPEGQAHSTKGPVIVLRTHRSVRAVAFHPSGENLLLSAEVQNPTPTAGLRPSKTARRPYVACHRNSTSRPGRVAEAHGLSSGATRSVSQNVTATDPNFRGVCADASAASGTRRRPPPVGEGSQSVNNSTSGFWRRSDEAIGPQCPQSSQGAGSMMDASSSSSPARLDTAMGDMGWLPPGSTLLPRSMVSLGWELPFPSASDRPSVRVAARLGLRRAQDGQPPLLQHVLAAFSAAAWNFVGEEQPARVRLRVWRYDPNRPVAPLSLELLTIEDAVLCSEMGVSFSPCGQYLAGVVACRSPVSTEYGLDRAVTEEGEEDADSDEEGYVALDGGFGDPTTARASHHHHHGIGDVAMQQADEPYHPQAVQPTPNPNEARTSVMQAYFNSRNINRNAAAATSAGQHWSSGLDRHTAPRAVRDYHTELENASEAGGGYNNYTQTMAPAAESREIPNNFNAGPPWLNASTTAANLSNRTDDQAPSVSVVSPPSPAAAAAQAVVYEVRVFALRPSTSSSFGEVMLARRVHAAHCLTSVQFSPCSRHLLLAYGKRHFSLLRSLVLERSGLRPLHTILEIVRLSDARLQRVLPSSEDEINAACWHPHPGHGLVYGTKEGRLRLVVRDCDVFPRSGEGRSSASNMTPIMDTLSPFEPPGSDVLLSYVAQLAAVPAAVLREPLQAILRNAGGGAPPQEDDARPGTLAQPTPWGPWRPRGQQTANAHLSVGGQAGAAPQVVAGQMGPPPAANLQRMTTHQPRGWGPQQADEEVGWLTRATGTTAGHAMTATPQAYDSMRTNLHRPFPAAASFPVMATARRRRDHQQMFHHQQPVGGELANPQEELVAPPLRVAIDDTLRVDALGPSAWPIWPLFDGERWEERVAPTGARLARVAAFAEQVLERLVAECMAPHEPVEPLLMAGGSSTFGVHRAAPSARLDVGRVREALLPALEAIWPPPEFVTPDLLASWAAYGRTYGIDPRWHWTCRWFWWTLRAWLESGGRPPGHRGLLRGVAAS